MGTNFCKTSYDFYYRLKLCSGIIKLYFLCNKLYFLIQYKIFISYFSSTILKLFLKRKTSQFSILSHFLIQEC